MVLLISRISYAVFENFVNVSRVGDDHGLLSERSEIVEENVTIIFDIICAAGSLKLFSSCVDKLLFLATVSRSPLEKSRLF